MFVWFLDFQYPKCSCSKCFEARDVLFTVVLFHTCNLHNHLVSFSSRKL